MNAAQRMALRSALLFGAAALLLAAVGPMQAAGLALVAGLVMLLLFFE